MALLKCDGVCKSYGKNSILKDINLENGCCVKISYAAAFFM